MKEKIIHSKYAGLSWYDKTMLIVAIIGAVTLIGVSIVMYFTMDINVYSWDTLFFFKSKADELNIIK